jgi:DNA-binding NtrC family response regulator
LSLGRFTRGSVRIFPELSNSGSLPGRAGGFPNGNEIVTLAEAERRYLRWALAIYRGDRRELARRLGLTERTFYRKTHELG